MKLVQCDECGLYNGITDSECASCGKQFSPPHTREARKKFRETHRRQKQHFDDEDDNSGDMNDSDHRNSRR